MHRNLLSSILLFQSVHGAPEATDGLELKRVAGTPDFRNPVAVSVDVDGTMYVTETERRKQADLDIREVRDWVPNDLSHTTIEEKRQFFRENVTPEAFRNHPSVKDHNRDGSIDWKDLTVHTEKIHRLSDPDGDGIYDEATVFADGFNTEVTGIAAGVLAWRGDVYTTIAPDVWKLRDTNGDGRADEREAIAHGFGIHINYAGHDMHGLTLGPDGRLYWTIGDKGTNVVSEEVRWSYPHDGAVLRCWPDGSGFEVFAHGLRNVQEIAFDEFGNLFGVDNDADLPGEKERLVFIPEGSDAGWRVHYQYRGNDYNPWTAENICVPAADFRPACWLPPLATSRDGPAGFAYNPGTALSERYRGHFFLSQFPAGKINAFTLEPDGAGFRPAGDHLVASGPAFVGINFGSDGALYATDWGGGYALNDQGAVWTLDAPDAAGSEIRREVAAMLKAGPGEVESAELARRLGHPDQRVRLDAQWELARREDWQTLNAIAFGGQEPEAVAHALWGLAQGKQFSASGFSQLSESPEPEIRAQAAKWAGDAGATDANLAPLLADDSARVRFQAAMAVAKLKAEDLIPEVIAMLEKNGGDDPYLVHAGAYALGMAATPTQLTLTKHPSPAVRRAAVVGLRRALDRHFRVTLENSPPDPAWAAERESILAGFLSDLDPAIVSEAAIAIYAEPVAKSAIPDLAALLEQNPAAPEPAIRRSIAANRRLATPQALLRLARFAADAGRTEALRLNALNVLNTAADGLQLDPVDGRWTDLSPVELPPALRSSLAVVLSTVGGSEALASAAGKSLDAVGERLDARQLAARAADTSLDPSLRLLALKPLKQMAPEHWTETADGMIRNGEPALRSAVAKLIATEQPATAFGYIKDLGLASEDLGERQSAVRLLGELETPEASKLISALVEDAVAGTAEPAMILEILEAGEAAGIDTSALAAKLKSGSPHLLAGGDAGRGRRIFETNLSANCTACHRIGPEGSEVGPPLTEAGRRDRAYLLKSLLEPQSSITEGYPAPSTMPPIGLILSQREIRDLVEFLTTLK